MISEKFVRLVKDNTDEIVRYWCSDIKENETTPSFRTFEAGVCVPYGKEILKGLGEWLDEKKMPYELKDIYVNLGKKRATDGLPLQDVISAHLILKRHIWLFVLSHGFLSNAFEIYQALELNNRVVNFFDQLIFHTIYGYETQTTAKIKKMEHLFVS